MHVQYKSSTFIYLPEVNCSVESKCMKESSRLHPPVANSWHLDWLAFFTNRIFHRIPSNTIKAIVRKSIPKSHRLLLTTESIRESAHDADHREGSVFTWCLLTLSRKIFRTGHSPFFAQFWWGGGKLRVRCEKAFSTLRVLRRFCQKRFRLIRFPHGYSWSCSQKKKKEIT